MIVAIIVINLIAVGFSIATMVNLRRMRRYQAKTRAIRAGSVAPTQPRGLGERP